MVKFLTLYMIFYEMLHNKNEKDCIEVRIVVRMYCKINQKYFVQQVLGKSTLSDIFLLNKL